MPPASASSQTTFAFGDQMHESLFDKLIHESVEVAAQFIGRGIELLL